MTKETIQKENDGRSVSVVEIDIIHADNNSNDLMDDLEMIEEDWTLYIFINTNLESMNPGKAMAQASHVSNAFIHKHYIKKCQDYCVDDDEPVVKWMEQTEQGFGTVKVLHADKWSDLDKFCDSSRFYGLVCDYVYDPEYPFLVSDELVNLLDSKEVRRTETKIDGKWLCLREEATGFYILGSEQDVKLQKALKRFQWEK